MPVHPDTLQLFGLHQYDGCVSWEGADALAGDLLCPWLFATCCSQPFELHRCGSPCWSGRGVRLQGPASALPSFHRSWPGTILLAAWACTSDFEVHCLALTSPLLTTGPLISSTTSLRSTRCLPASRPVCTCCGVRQTGWLTCVFVWTGSRLRSRCWLWCAHKSCTSCQWCSPALRWQQLRRHPLKRAAAGIFFSIFTTFLVWADYHFAGTRSSSEQVQ